MAEKTVYGLRGCFAGSERLRGGRTKPRWLELGRLAWGIRCDYRATFRSFGLSLFNNIEGYWQNVWIWVLLHVTVDGGRDYSAPMSASSTSRNTPLS
jgi:hypothetical protein